MKPNRKKLALQMIAMSACIGLLCGCGAKKVDHEVYVLAKKYNAGVGTFEGTLYARLRDDGERWVSNGRDTVAVPFNHKMNSVLQHNKLADKMRDGVRNEQ